MNRRSVSLMVAAVLATILVSLTPSPAAANNGWWYRVSGANQLWIRQCANTDCPLIDPGRAVLNDQAHAFRQRMFKGEQFKAFGQMQGECVRPGICAWLEVERGGYVYSGYTIPVPDPPELAFACPGDGKCIVIDRAALVLYAFEDGRRVYSTYISNGGDKTPLGAFVISAKVPKDNMIGKRELTDLNYFIVDVEYQMTFFGLYKIHATYTHFWFGVAPVSNGCINLSLSDARWLYNWAPIGTLVIIGDDFTYLPPISSLGAHKLIATD